jgi:hypothetical protein
VAQAELAQLEPHLLLSRTFEARAELLLSSTLIYYYHLLLYDVCLTHYYYKARPRTFGRAGLS